MAEMMIPMLPCVSLPATLAFYRALGFDCTHQQTSPNVYAALQRGGIHLHFFGLKGLKPEDKNDDRAAAKVLDAALAKKDPAPAIDRARALAARIELAVVLDDTGRADALRRELESLPLADEERQRVRAELPAVDEGSSKS